MFFQSRHYMWLQPCISNKYIGTNVRFLDQNITNNWLIKIGKQYINIWHGPHINISHITHIINQNRHDTKQTL